MSQIQSDTKVTLSLLIPILSALIAGTAYIIADHSAIADLQQRTQKLDRLEVLAIDVAVIKQKVTDLNEKLDKKAKDDNGEGW